MLRFSGDTREPHTATPIKHVVIIFGENESFDHYFGTYPRAANVAGEPRFVPLPLTPPVNGLSYDLLYNNPNFTNKANNNPTLDSIAANPFRLDRTQAVTADQDHDYAPEQQAFDHGRMDLFPLYTGTAGTGPKRAAPISHEAFVRSQDSRFPCRLPAADASRAPFLGCGSPPGRWRA
jgi:phospholipase C